jgi:predicted phage replisome organizer
MAEIKWIKIVTDVFDDEKILMIESMPEADSVIVIWFKLLCLAGKQNNSGVFLMGRMPYTDEMFSTIFRRPLNTVRMALKTFEQFGMIEIVNNTVTIPNWGKHQSIEQIEAKNEYMRNYMKEYRAKQKLISEGRKVNCKTNSKANVSSAEEIREEEIIEDKSRGDIEDVNDINVGSKPPKAVRHKYGYYELVLLTDEDYEKLKAEFPHDYSERIARLDEYIASTGKKYKNHLATIRAWARKDTKPQGRPVANKSSNPFLDMLEDGSYE